MKLALQIWFGFVLISMLAVTIWASGDRNVVRAIVEIAADPWGLAALMDAWYGFLAFYLWLWLREVSGTARGLWLIAILLLGNIAISVYVLLALRHWRGGAEALLLGPRGRVS